MTPGSAVSVSRSMIFSSDPQVDHLVRSQLQRGAARDDLALRQAHGRQAVDRHADFGRKGRVVGLGKGLLVVRRLLRQHHRIDQHARHLDLARVRWWRG